MTERELFAQAPSIHDGAERAALSSTVLSSALFPSTKTRKLSFPGCSGPTRQCRRFFTPS